MSYLIICTMFNLQLFRIDWYLSDLSFIFNINSNCYNNHSFQINLAFIKGLNSMHNLSHY
nr:MAG TPA: hypothetical protein [Caudoviricetes sp.]